MLTIRVSRYLVQGGYQMLQIFITCPHFFLSVCKQDVVNIAH